MFTFCKIFAIVCLSVYLLYCPFGAGCAVAGCIYPNEVQYELPGVILYRADPACVSNELSTTRCF